MKVLVVSDTHGKNDLYFKLLEMHKPDRVIHCGDIEGSEYALDIAAKCPVDMVSGNNDFFSDLPKETEVRACGKKIWVTHGHRYYVSMGTSVIMDEAASRGYDIVCYGHTHRPGISYGNNGVIAVNPGSLSYPRQEGREPSFAMIETDRFGEMHIHIGYLKNV